MYSGCVGREYVVRLGRIFLKGRISDEGGSKHGNNAVDLARSTDQILYYIPKR